ncbi:unnamed protein product, partial [Sphacelaria rigidula]
RQLGHASTDHIPRELRIMGRTIQTDKEVTKWYDLPLTEEEIERGNTLGVVVVSVSSCRDASNHPLIDALEVYARKRGAKPSAAGSSPSSALPTQASSTHSLAHVTDPIVEALSACSLLLGSALGLALETAEESTSMAVNGDDGDDEKMTGDNDPANDLHHRVEDGVLAGISQSAMSVLRSTCLAAKPR